jgi:hypothetical protein
MRAIGLDIHRGFCEVAIAEEGQVRPARRVGTAPAELEAFGASLRPGDVVTLVPPTGRRALDRRQRCGRRKRGAHLTTLSVNQRGRDQPRTLRFGPAITRTAPMMRLTREPPQAT